MSKTEIRWPYVREDDDEDYVEPYDETEDVKRRDEWDFDI